MAFLSENIKIIKDILDKENVFYKSESLPESGINQIFFFDPDGNVIEVSNCAPQIGQIICSLDFEKSTSRDNILIENESCLLDSDSFYIS